MKPSSLAGEWRIANGESRANPDPAHYGSLARIGRGTGASRASSALYGVAAVFLLSVLCGAQDGAEEPHSIGERGVADRYAIGRLPSPNRVEPPEVASATGSRALELASKPALHGQLPLTASFAAHIQTNGMLYRPDATGAVGKDHVVSMTWEGIRVHHRDGTVVSEATLEQFWAPLGPFKAVSPGACNTNTYTIANPMLRYDPLGDRWIAIATASSGSDEGSLLLGVSKSGDPSGEWVLQRFFADASKRHLFEFPNVGFGPRWIVIQAGVTVGYDLGNQTSAGSQIWVFDKAALYGGDREGHFTVFKRTDLNYSQFVVSNYDVDSGVMYLVGLGNDQGNEVRNSLRLYTISGQTGHEVFGLGPTVTSPVSWRNIPSGGFSANTLPQMGTNAMIAPQDSVPLSAMQRAGSIWVAHHVQLPITTTRRTSVQWWQIDGRGKVLQRGLIDDPGNKVHYAFPSIGVNQYGDALVGYSRFATNQYPSANCAWRLANDPPGTLQPDTVLKEGAGPFVWPNPCVAKRTEWGWYSATIVDPANDSDLWTLQQYAAAPAGDRDRWATWWGRFTPWPSLALRVEAPATVTSGRDPQLIATGSLKPENGSIPFRARIWNRASFTVSNIVVRLENAGGCPVFALELPPGPIQVAAVDGGMGAVWTGSMSKLREGEWVEFLWGLCGGSPGHTAPPGILTNLLSVTLSHEPSPITATGITSVVSDVDDDDLPDDWESTHGLSPGTAADADQDADADGLSNRQEYQAGTKPGDPTSRVEIVSVTRVTIGTSPGWRLLTRTVNGQFYRIERAERLTNPQWLTVADEIRGVSGTVAVTDPDTTSSGQRFYRAFVLP